jgi:branched-chain amino acid aminotransferase
MTLAERQVYLNGEFLPDSQARIPVRDSGIVYGDGVFDTARTFDGKLFRAREHVDRLYASIALARIPEPMPPSEMLALTEDLVARNQAALRPGEDFWVSQRVTMGMQAMDGEPSPRKPTVIIDCVPLPLRARARYFRDGIDVRIAARPKIAPEALSPNAKTLNYLNMTLAQREVDAEHPGAWALMRDRDGHLAEGAGCNVFFVKGGEVFTPADEFVLAGISRQVVMELCADLQMRCHVGTVPDDLAFSAEEGFFTSTSLCLCPLRSLEGGVFPADVPGPVTTRLMQAFSDLVQYDYVAQYLRFLSAGPVSTGL